MVRKGTNHFGGSGSGWGPNMDPCHIVESQKIDPYHIAFLARVADPDGFTRIRPSRKNRFRIQPKKIPEYPDSYPTLKNPDSGPTLKKPGIHPSFT